MCTYSMSMDWIIKQPKEVWIQPFWPPAVEDLLKRSKQYDAENGEPDCELESKREVLRKIAKEMGVEITFP